MKQRYIILRNDKKGECADMMDLFGVLVNRKINSDLETKIISESNSSSSFGGVQEQTKK